MKVTVLTIGFVPRDDLEIDLRRRLASRAKRDACCRFLKIEFVEIAREAALRTLVRALPLTGLVSNLLSQLPSPSANEVKAEVARSAYVQFPAR